MVTWTKEKFWDNTFGYVELIKFFGLVFLIMPRKKNIKFKLDPEWMFKEPLDFEYNKYTVLDYIQKCEKRFDKLEIYPDFVELSLHLANLQSLSKENLILFTTKKFESCDDEILLKELLPKKPRELSPEEESELDKTIKFSGSKLFDTFNIGKSIWNLAFDNIHLSIRKNKENISTGRGFVYFYFKEIEKLFIWEYEIKKLDKGEQQTKLYLKLLYEGPKTDIVIGKLISETSTWKEISGCELLPIFEVKTSQNFPMEQTFIPMMKRKLMTYVYQIVNMEILKNFDTSIQL